MKGILLAGGSGTRLSPLTKVTSKQLLPVYDKPMVHYPLSTLMLAGIREILIITTPHDSASFQALLGEGSQWGISLSYAVQERPAGIAEALIIGRDFAAGCPVALILGDNLFFGHGLTELLINAASLSSGAEVFAYHVDNPRAFGVVTLDADGEPISIVEKPETEISRWAVTGLYFYDGDAPQMAESLTPSGRGELEITDVNRAYLEMGKLAVTRLGRGFAWLDTGTHEQLLEAAMFVSVLERRQGIKVACIEEVAFRKGYIGSGQLEMLADQYGATAYAEYIRRVAEGKE